MTTENTNFPAGGRLYMAPAGLVLGPSIEGCSLSLAGGLYSFTGLDIIAAYEGQRTGEWTVPLGQIEGFKASLPSDYKKRFDLLFNNISTPRADLSLGKDKTLSFETPNIMGVLNITPDSFSDGGDHRNTDIAMGAAVNMVEEGADILDIGGESTRPGAAPVSEEDERTRVLPVFRALKDICAPKSIDSRRAGVMTAALAAGADIINDVSALKFDTDSLEVAVRAKAPVILMHAKGNPETMQDNPEYGDVLLEVFDYLEARVESCEKAGIPRDKIWLDPGIGFGKNLDHNLHLLKNIGFLHGLGCVLMLGVSRKRLIGELTNEPEAKNRVMGSVSAALFGISQGAQVVRVHDVKETKQALQVMVAIATKE